MIKSGIYKLVSKKTGEFYIGSSQKLRKRNQDHFSLIRNNKHPNRYLQSVWNKRNDIIFEIIERCSIESLVEREQYYIDSLCPKYNLRPLAESNRGWKMPESAKRKLSRTNKGRPISEETKRKISKANKGKLKGRKLPKSHVEAIRKVRTGWKLSSETKDKIREKALGRDLGKELSDSTKRKIGLSSSKKVYQYSLDNKFINSYLSCSDADRKLDINRSSIASCCRGKRLTAGGFKWYYEKQNN